MLVLDHSAAHKFVRDQRRKGSDVRWDGWTMVFWQPTHHGFTNVKGAYRKGRWGMESRIEVAGDGFWRVPGRNVKTA
jgi:hypothetical protein